MSTKPNIGWIGLGVMGSPMVFNLVSAGYPVSVFSRTKSKAVTVLEAGAGGRMIYVNLLVLQILFALWLDTRRI